MSNLAVDESRVARLAESYDEFIKRAYIDPIRTVIVVDDEFPSLDGLIEKELKGARPWAGLEEDAKRVREILSFCRTKQRPWLVDVHDGREVSIAGEEKIAPYLHHSDLMILDYHLAGDAGTGDHAIKILRDLASNDHFNMVIVYTKGENGSIESVFRQIAIGLTCADSKLALADIPRREVDNVIAKLEDDDPEIVDKLLKLVSNDAYLSIRRLDNPRALTELPDWDAIREQLAVHADTKSVSDALWSRWLIEQTQERIAGQLSQVDLGKIAYSWDNEFNWIRTDSLFVTVVSKSHHPHELPEKLLSAIRNWCPSPHQLLMAKMRAQMDERGVLAESGVLRDRFLQAGWMQQLFAGAVVDKKQTLKNTVDRHWEALGDNLRADIDLFAGELAEHLESLGRDEVFRKFIRIDWSENEASILKRLNIYANLKTTFEHSHLMTGHLLKFENGELWACLSPACDLVPGQKEGGWFRRLGDHMPFMAVLLHKVGDEIALSLANQNIFVFGTSKDDEDCYSFCPGGKIQNNPQWEQMFAANGGRFSDSVGSISIGRLAQGAAGIEFKSNSVRVVGQLRYEYALNLLQRLGTNFSRIGLDFHAPPKVD
ncbi:response regulator receiver domain [Burkholderia metallica]|uniref:response regulator receiver domain n=1 Tax=Burkholderia metallica TaxID=488729 RepID=UPI000AD9692F|nr:response regulator receiver domain [Burkholderia metallica]